jgi:hypothetical protein
MRLKELSILGCGVALIATSVIGCAVPRMAPPADVAGASEVLIVSDRSRASGALVSEGFKVGGYEVTDVDRDWNSTSSVGIGPWSKETKTTGFAYALQSKGKKLTGKCASEKKSQGIFAMGGTFSWGDLQVACTCEGESGKAELLMTKDGRSLKLGGREYKVEPINSLEGGGTQSEPSGFRADADELLGAVEVQHPGQIWLKKGLDDTVKEQASCVFVGLMLYQPPKDD